MFRRMHQIGKTNMAYDIARKAFHPGIRKSVTGKRYYEYRKNRSDWHGSV